MDSEFGFGYDLRWIWINRGGGAYRIHPIQPGPAVTRHPGNFKFQICDFKFQSGTSRLSNRDFKCQSGTSRLHRVCARNTPRTMFPPQESFSTNWEMRDLTAAERIGPFAADWVGRFPKVAFTVALINEHSAIYPL